MTPGRLRECLRAMHWTNATLAEALGCTETLVIAWVLGFTEIPDEVGDWIEPLGHAHEKSEQCRPKSLRGSQLTGWEWLRRRRRA
jgi:hypothetical protein